MGAAATEIGRHVGAQLGFGRLVVAFQKRLRTHDHAGDAVTALCCLLGLERGRQRAGFFRRSEAFDRAHLALGQGRDRQQAGEGGLVVDEHGAGAALPQPAAELGAVEAEIVAQGVEQRRIRVGVDSMGGAVDGQGDHSPSPLRAWATAWGMSSQGGLSV